jgi:surface polysaccharide O-acyltransferase-like enzyme
MESSGRFLSLESDSPVVAIVAFAIFCFFHQNNKTNRVIEFLSPLCFGIYLIHPLFLFSLYLFLGFTPEKYPLVLIIPGTISFTVLLSIGFTYFGSEIGIIRKFIL